MIQSQLNAQVKYSSAAAECTSTIRHEILCCCLSLGIRLLPSRGQHLLSFTIPSTSNCRSYPLHDLQTRNLHVQLFSWSFSMIIAACLCVYSAFKHCCLCLHHSSLFSSDSSCFVPLLLLIFPCSFLLLCSFRTFSRTKIQCLINSLLWNRG